MDTVHLELGGRAWVRAVGKSAEEAAEAAMGTGGNRHEEGYAHRDDPLDDLVSSEGDANAFTGSYITLKLQLLTLAQTQMDFFCEQPLSRWRSR